MLIINNKLRIRKLDETNLVMEKLKIVSSEVKGTREEWVFEGYYGSLEWALSSVLKKELFDSLEEEVEIKDLLKVIEKTSQDIRKEVKKYNIKI